MAKEERAFSLSSMEDKPDDVADRREPEEEGRRKRGARDETKRSIGVRMYGVMHIGRIDAGLAMRMSDI